MSDNLVPDHIMQLGLGFWGSKALLSAVELGVFTELAKAPADLEALQQKLGLHSRSARDFFDALVALKVLRRNGSTYSNTAEADAFLDRSKPSYVGGMMELADKRLYGSWGLLSETLRTGQPQSEAKDGQELFSTIFADPQKLRAFLSGMSGISLGAANALATKFDWKAHKTVMDVGTAQGMVPVTLSRKHPHLKAIGFDLPAVRPVFEDYVSQHGLTDRVRFQAGNFFEDALPSADVIIMGHILHDWDLSQKKALLRSAHQALPKRGVLIVYEAIIDDDRQTNAFGLLMSLNMAIETPGGFDYTGADCQEWMREAGFTETRVEHLTGPDSMVIGIKN
jgi:hypothetical protein